MDNSQGLKKSPVIGPSHHHHDHLKFNDFIKSLSSFFQRDLISIPLVKKYPHNQVTKRCGLKAATLELDTAAYPNIEYIAGNRLSIYPINPLDHVDVIVKHVQDDITLASTTSSPHSPKARRQHQLTDIWSRFVQLHGRDSIRLALVYLYDITTAPSRDLLRIMAENCLDRSHKSRLIHISKSDEAWEKWVCSGLRTLKSTFEEFSSCSLAAKVLFSELTLQQPRQYSISSIKSSKRFRTEIIVIQHRFDTRQIAITLESLKEQDLGERSTGQERHQPGENSHDASPSQLRSSVQSHPTSVRVSHGEPVRSARSSASIRSLRSIVSFGVSPISTQQVRKVPAYSGPLVSQYASGIGSLGPNSRLGSRISASRLARDLDATGKKGSNSNSLSSGRQYEGLCSNYLLNLNSSDHIICEFVENPRFTLKGNRERPILMIGQDVGLIAFRAFWQQRGLEHDRAQMFYTLFRDLSPKKFGDLQLVCLTGNICKIEDLFRHTINYELTRKVLSSVLYVDCKQLANILDKAALTSNVDESPSASLDGRKKIARAKRPQSNITMDKDLVELGDRISSLLVDNNGCLYTCCDRQMTQAIDILIMESVLRNHPSLNKGQVMALLNKWKGNSKPLAQPKSLGEGKNFIYTFENPFERAQVVQEIYDVTI